MDRTGLSIHFKEKLLENGMDENEYMEMNGRLLREKDPEIDSRANEISTQTINITDDAEKVIVVESSKELAKWLEDEGYRIWHKPWFAMPRYTHSKWTVSPDKIKALDAAKNDSEAITTEEYIRVKTVPGHI